jgi:hypothetical protein
MKKDPWLSVPKSYYCIWSVARYFLYPQIFIEFEFYINFNYLSYFKKLKLWKNQVWYKIKDKYLEMQRVHNKF